MTPDAAFFSIKTTLNCRGRLLDLSRGCVMGILNITPDSFYDGGKFASVDAGLEQAAQMLKEGASIIDIGGYSTRPGADEVSLDEELKRVIPMIEKIHRQFPDAVLSIDTFRAKTASEAVAAGASIVNDISGGEDPEMFDTVARLQVPYILMHRQGNPKDMQLDPHYEDVTKELLQFFSFKTGYLKKMGLNDIVIDPGFGFGKTLIHNFLLLNNLNLFRMLGYPVLAGLSRKSMINKVIGTKPENALSGTIAVNTMALLNGCSILRVHDVKPAVEALKVVNYCREVASTKREEGGMKHE